MKNTNLILYFYIVVKYKILKVNLTNGQDLGFFPNIIVLTLRFIFVKVMLSITYVQNSTPWPKL